MRKKVIAPGDRDLWNELIAVRDNIRFDGAIRAMAELMLKQLNTAGGRDIMEEEIIGFLDNLKSVR